MAGNFTYPTAAASATLAASDTITGNRAKVRLRLRDIDPNDPKFTDEEIDAVLTERAGVLVAAVELARRLVARYSTDTDVNGAGISSSRSQKFTQAKELLEILEAAMATETELYVGGVSIDEADSEADDSDFPAPAFRIGMHRNTGSTTGWA